MNTERHTHLHEWSVVDCTIVHYLLHLTAQKCDAVLSSEKPLHLMFRFQTFDPVAAEWA